MDEQPLKAKDRELLPLLCHVIRECADFICCEPRDLVLVETATWGINTILRSLKFQPGDIILTLSLGYGKSTRRYIWRCQWCQGCNALPATPVSYFLGKDQVPSTVRNKPMQKYLMFYIEAVIL